MNAATAARWSTSGSHQPGDVTGSAPGQVPIEGLFAQWHEHRDPRAREALVRHYLPLATRLARRYRGAWEPPEDLLQVASLGLLKAIDRFDPARGLNFRTYAVPTILGEIKRYFRDCGWSIHVPRGIQDLALRVEQAQRTLLSDSGRPATVQQLALYLELSMEDVCDALEASAAHHASSLDVPRGDNDEGDATTLLEALGRSDEAYERVEDSMCLADACQLLTDRERRVLHLKFIEDRSQVQIASEIGVSQMQVSRILRATLDRLSETVEARSR